MSLQCALGLSQHEQEVNSTGNTFATRFLYTVCPSIYYKKKPDYFHDILKGLANDLCKLYHTGIRAGGKQVFFPVCLGVKGDWPWLAKAGKILRHFNRQSSHGICHLCLAGKTDTPWEDLVSRQPFWLSTVSAEAPWREAGELLAIPHCNITEHSFYKIDLFHTWKVGVGQEFVASCIIVAIENNYFTSQAIAAGMDEAWSDFHTWCRTHHKSPHMSSFTRNTLGFESNTDYPQGSWHGSDTILLVRWLKDILPLRRNINEEVPGYMVLGCESILLFLDTLYRSPLWLEPDIAKHVCEAGFLFLHSYTCLANICYSLGVCRFATKPKLHMFHHFLISLNEAVVAGHTSILNPLCFNCEADEDFVGRCSRISRKTATATKVLRTLQRYLINCKTHWASNRSSEAAAVQASHMCFNTVWLV